MSNTNLSVGRAPITQPSRSNTKKSQKRGNSQDQKINNELDYLHERINLIVVEADAITDLVEDGTATNAEMAIAINDILGILRDAGLLRAE